MHLIFLSEQELSVLDYGYATDDFDIILDALKDSALVFAFVFVIHIILSFFEHNKKAMKGRVS